MPDITINGVIVTFPFNPYAVQEDYMTKVIECLQNKKNAVLESPTGTGKTLSLLCSSLSWLLAKKAQLQIQAMAGAMPKPDFGGKFLKQLNNGLEKAAGASEQSANFGWSMPKIIYASRTHSQLSQAMQELKRTSYNHVKSAVLGSRDQLCIHPEVSRESNSFNKIQMCQSKVRSRTCFYYNNVANRKDDPLFKQEVLDIEDLVKVGKKMRCCPYFLCKELKQSADIVFMPYNYLLDPKTRKSQDVELENSVILLDEAHNVEKTCENSASLQVCSTDIALCIDEITVVMQDIAKDIDLQSDIFNEHSGNIPKDFTAEDLCTLKAMFLELEKVVDEIQLKNYDEGDSYPGGFIFELLEKVQLTHGKEQCVIEKCEKIISYLTTTNTSPFARKGNGLQKFIDLLRTVFSTGTGTVLYRERIKECYKVYIQIEEQKKTYKNDCWETRKKIKKNIGKIISYWCFSPGFGMQQLVNAGIHSIVLTSGTLSPLKPFISELGIPIEIQLENPHIVSGRQVCIGVLSQGPDGYTLNSSFNTRNDPKYIASLGRTIYNFSCLIPHGVLIFFASYPIMKKCQEEWQNDGLWTKIAVRKPIYVEPQSKDGLNNVMNEYYQKIQDPSYNGAIFMAVCRGKISEGLDFANANGRAVIITGLPYPPLKDPRVILKQKYLEEMRTKDKQALTGQQWYQLEASRAVNQAIGRIIRHQNDYGAVILCDCRFENVNFKKQLSSWLQPHVKNFANFGIVTKELRDFFRYATYTFPQPKLPFSEYKDKDFSISATTAAFDTVKGRILKNPVEQKETQSSQETDCFNFEVYANKATEERTKPEEQSIKRKTLSELLTTESKSVINFSDCTLKGGYSNCELTKDNNEPLAKKRKIKIVPIEVNSYFSQPSTSNCSLSECSSLTTRPKCDAKQNIVHSDKKEIGKVYLKDVKRTLSSDNYKVFGKMIQNYTKHGDFNALIHTLETLFLSHVQMRPLFIGFKSFLKKQHISQFNDYIINME